MIKPTAQRALVAIPLLLLACAARKPGDPIRPGYNIYSVEQDIQLGQQAAAEIRKQVDVVDDDRLQAYVRSIGERLAAQPDAGEYPYSFTLINEDSINAFALPGGPVFVHSGLLEATENEAQFASVLAHEIAHAALRHGTNQASKAQIIQIPAVLAGAVIGQGSVAAQAGQIGMALGLNALMLKYSRTAEKQADALGARILAGAGYNPLEMAAFFEKLEGEGGRQPPAWLSSHPNPGRRQDLIHAELVTFPTATYDYVSGQFPSARTLVAQLPPPQRPQQSAVVAEGSRPPDAPTGAFRQLNTRSFSLEYPDGWQVFGDQQSPVVTIAPQQGLVRNAGGGVGLGYGAVLSYYRPQSARGLRDAASELVAELRAANPTMQVTSSRTMRVQGSSAMLVYLVSESPYGGRELDVLLTVGRPEGLFYMVFVGPERGFSQLEPAFDRMLTSIRFP